MRGIQSPLIEYVLEADRELLPEEKTVWYLKTMSVKERIPITNSYAKSLKTDMVKGGSSYDEDKMWRAKRAEWLATVEKVKNYQFGYKYAEMQAKGPIDVESPQELAMILEDLPSDCVTELMDAANKMPDSEILKKK